MKPARILLLAALLGLAAGCDVARLRDRQTGQVRVTTVPPGATITCDGVAQDVSPVTLGRVEPGSHLLIARKEGYQEARKTISLLADQKMAVELTLEPVYGLVLVDSDPPEADVALDGAYRGKTPLLLPDFPLGAHRLLVRREGYVEKEVELTVADRVPRKVDVELLSDTARLNVVSDPPGAVVRINGSQRGLTPLDLDAVPTGEVRLEMALDGFRAYQQDLRLSRGERREVRAVLEPVPGALTVVSAPPDARVYVNDQYRGQSPLNLHDLEPGSYRVRVEAPGYETDARTLTVSATERLTEEFRLLKNSGLLVITTEPAGVKVYVDGEAKGATPGPDAAPVSEPLEIDLLPQGPHTVQLTRAGYVRRSRNILVAPDKIVTLHEKLARQFIPDTAVRIGEGPDGLRKGVLLETSPNGDIRLEVRPGVIIGIPADNIMEMKPLEAP